MVLQGVWDVLGYYAILFAFHRSGLGTDHGPYLLSFTYSTDIILGPQRNPLCLNEAFMSSNEWDQVDLEKRADDQGRTGVFISTLKGRKKITTYPDVLAHIHYQCIFPEQNKGCM